MNYALICYLPILVCIFCIKTPNNRIQSDTKSRSDFVANSKCLSRLFVQLILVVGPLAQAVLL